MASLGSSIRSAARATSSAYRRLPIRWRLAGGSAVLTLVILMAFAAIVGVAGRYMSMASGPNAERPPSTASMPSRCLGLWRAEMSAVWSTIVDQNTNIWVIVRRGKAG